MNHVRHPMTAAMVKFANKERVLLVNPMGTVSLEVHARVVRVEKRIAMTRIASLVNIAKTTNVRWVAPKTNIAKPTKRVTQPKTNASARTHAVPRTIAKMAWLVSKKNASPAEVTQTAA